MVTMSTITTKLGTLTPSDLPSPPDIAIRIVRACGDPAVSNKELREIIGSDSTLTMELLRIVNAPFFGLRQPVTRMEQVLVVLGHRRLRNIALLFIARETLRLQTISSAELRGYWEESLLRAVSLRIAQTGSRRCIRRAINGWRWRVAGSCSPNISVSTTKPAINC